MSFSGPAGWPILLVINTLDAAADLDPVAAFFIGNPPAVASLHLSPNKATRRYQMICWFGPALCQ